MDPKPTGTPLAKSSADTSADDILAEALAAESAAPPDPFAYPGAREVAARVVVAVVIGVLGYASWASGALIPLLWVFDFGIHEFGHLITYWAPWRVTAAAGSVLQVAFPLALAAYAFFARRSWSAAAMLVAWAGCSARNVAVYIADAPYQRLALWGGDGTLHDWAQLLAGRQMQHAETIASAANAAGWLLVAAGLALALAPLVVRTASAYSRRARRAADEAFEATLPVREPHGPIG